jgi:osmotically-inducible protein OsmY
MQRPATEFAAVWKFRFGSPLATNDGELGTIAALGVEPANRALICIGVKFGVFGSTHYLPLSAVLDADVNAASAGLTREAIEKSTGELQGNVNFTARTRVVLNARRLGSLTQVTINRETHALRHLVVDRGLGGEVLVSAIDISQVDARQILLDVAQAGAQPVVPFRPDAELYDEVHRAIENYARLRIDLEGIQIHAIDGVVWLKGHVSSELNRRLVQDQLTGIRGLAELHNELVADPELAAAVSAALARDPRAAGERIGVYPELGDVRLRGIVRTTGAREAAAQIAAGVPGVRSVQNDLRIDPAASVLPVLASVTNEEDRVPGGG